MEAKANGNDSKSGERVPGKRMRPNGVLEASFKWYGKRKLSFLRTRFHRDFVMVQNKIKALIGAAHNYLTALSNRFKL